MNGIKKIISAVLVCAMILLTLPATVIPVKALDDPYFEEFGVTYNQLFTLYPEYLNSYAEGQVTNVAIKQYTSVLERHKDSDDYIPAFITTIKEDLGFSIALREILAEFGLSESTEKKMLLDTTTLLLNNICNSETAASAIVSDVENNFSNLKGTYDLATSAGKSEFIKAVQKACKWIPDSQIDSIADTLFSEAAEDSLKKINSAVEFCDVLITFFAMQEIETALVKNIANAVPQNSGLYEALNVYLEERGTAAAFIDTYLNDKIIETVSKKLLDVATSVSVPVKVAAEALSFCANVLYQGPNATDVYAATILGGYVQGMYSAVAAKRISFRQAALVGADEIAEYEVLYTAYIESIRTTLESTKALASTEQEGNIDDAIALCDRLAYDNYIRLCMTALKADIDAGVVAAPGSVVGDVAACVKEMYPSYGKIVITKDSANIMDRPCSVKTDTTAQLVESGALDAEYTVTGLYLNTADNHWYQIITKNGGTGYIYSGNCTFKEFLSDVVLTGLDVPSHIDVGSRYWIKGTVSTVYTNLSTVSFLVYDQNGTFRTGGTVDVSGKSYVLDYSDLDTATEFNILPAGIYRCVVEATLENNSASACWTETVTLHTSDLVVESEYTNESSLTYTDLLLNINYTNITQVGYQPHYTNSCGCFAMAYCRTLLDGYVHNWYEYNYATSGTLQGGLFDTSTHINSSGWWAQANYVNKDFNSKKDAFRYVYNELVAGRPVVARVFGTYQTIQHYVTIVGFQNVTSLDALSESNFLIIDSIKLSSSAGGIITRQGLETMPAGSNNYTLKLDNGTYELIVNGYHSKENGIEYSAIGSCSHRYKVTETPASCTRQGIREYTCSSCGDTYTEQIEALGHNYAATKTDATCTTAGYTTYTCSRCDDSYVETSDGCSEWSAEYPTGVPESLIEQKTQYSTLEKVYTTSTSDILDGWTNCGIAYSDWGPVQTTTTKPTESSTLRITDTVQTGWGYYHWCNYYYNGGNNWNIDSVQYGGPCYWHGYTSNFELPGIYFQDQGGQQAYGGIDTGASPCPYNFYIWFRDTGADVYTYSYQTRSEVKQFYKWSDKWSNWDDTEVTGNEDRQVKTQTLYRYHMNGLADHNYSYAVTIPPTSDITGILTGTCGVCADTTTVILPKLNTVDYTYSVIKEPSCTEPGTGRYTWNVTTYGNFYFDINKTMLKFAGASLSLQHNLAINYKVDKALFEDVGYSDPYVVFELNGVETRVSDYTISDDKYVFAFRNIAPNQMNDTIRATLYATYDGIVYASETREYSVSQYCYSMLDSCNDDKYAKLRTLLVDLLHYGAASQTYTGYKTDTLVNATLTEEQMQWGTSTNPTLTSVLDTTYITVAEPSARWKGAGLNLQESVSIRLKFTAESVEGLTVRIKSDDCIWTISSDKFLEEDGVYYVYFTGLDAGQMRQSVYLTIYKGEMPVSNTACYSIESYAAEKQNSTVGNLPELVRAMMRYGDSAYAYIQ